MQYSTRLASVAIALAAIGSHAMAATLPPGDIGVLNSSGTTFGNTFYQAKPSFIDYYTFSIANNGTVSGTTTDASLWLSKDVSISSLVLTYGTNVLTTIAGVDSAIPTDGSLNGFTFTGLTAGAYTLAVNGAVSNGFSLSASYSGTIKTAATSTASVASAAPEPADMALTLMGLAGVGFMVRRRAAR
jgi:MYXO-CTERM domain-containing protein